jgi:hypothetical protein
MADGDHPASPPPLPQQRSGCGTIAMAVFGLFLLLPGLCFLQMSATGAGLIGLLLSGAAIFLLHRAVSGASRRNLLLIGVLLLLPGLCCLIMFYEGIMRGPTAKEFATVCLMLGFAGIAIISWAFRERRS